MTLMRALHDELGPTEVQALGQEIGTDEGATGNAVDTAIPMMIVALAERAREPVIRARPRGGDFRRGRGHAPYHLRRPRTAAGRGAYRCERHERRQRVPAAAVAHADHGLGHRETDWRRCRLGSRRRAAHGGVRRSQRICTGRVRDPQSVHAQPPRPQASRGRRRNPRQRLRLARLTAAEVSSAIQPAISYVSSRNILKPRAG